MKPHEFIAKIAPAAIEDMRRHGVPASLTIAQAILESNWGKSGLTQKANNLFGIKGTGPAGSITMPTDEYRGQTRYTTNAKFRKYHSWDESIEDHTRLILNGTRDNPKRYHGVLWADYKTAATEIWKGGYATDPGYPPKLISIIEKYDLDQYDRQGREEEDMMKIETLTAEVKKLQEQVRLLTDQHSKQGKLVDKQESQIKKLQKTVDSLQKRHTYETVPVWAEPAVEAALKVGVIQDKEGSYDFYRMITVLYRLGLLDNIK